MSPKRPVSKSYTLMLTIAPPGRISGTLIASQLYAERFNFLFHPLHSVSVYTVVLKHAHP